MKNKAKYALKWLQSACNPKTPLLSDVHMHTPHARNGKTYASDGYRLFIVGETLAVENEAEMPRPIDYDSLVPRQRTENVAQVSAAHLKQAVTACKPFAYDSAKIVRFSMNGVMEISASSAYYGDCHVSIVDGDEQTVKGKSKPSTVVYKHSGADVCFALNYKYLLDALAGLPEIVTVNVRGPQYPVYLSDVVDGVLREAVIMPMSVG
jgi:DNA polymerase III sliding clamp (beta) subunit (PCNA family)